VGVVEGVTVIGGVFELDTDDDGDGELDDVAVLEGDGVDERVEVLVTAAVLVAVCETAAV